MRKNVWAWIAGGAVFAAVAGVWIWLLPGIIRAAAGGQDAGLAGIFSSFKGTGGALAPDLTKLQEQIGKNIDDFDKAVTATAQAQAIGEVKKKIEADAVKKKIEAAVIKDQEPNSKDQ